MNTTVPATSLTKDPNAAGLALIICLAIDELTSSFRFFLAVKDSPGPGGARDRFWAMLQTIALLQEIRATVAKHSKDFRTFVKAHNPTSGDEELKRAHASLAKTELESKAHEVRNSFAFHWSRSAMTEWAKNYSKPTVCWTDGDNDLRGETLHQVAQDAVMQMAFGTTRESLEQREAFPAIPNFFDKLLEAHDSWLGVLDSALAGYLKDFPKSFDRRSAYHEPK